MRRTRCQPVLVLVLAFAMPFATAQWSNEDQKNWDAHMYSLERFHEKERDASERQRREQGQEPGGGGGSGIAAALILAIVGGALLEWSRQPQAQRPQRDYVEETRRQRQGLVYRQCTSAHQSSLVKPQYQKPNSWPLVRIFQSDRAEEFRTALARYETALAEGEPTCRCAGERSVSAGGFSDAEWATIATGARAERPWMVLEEPRARSVFDACAAHAPSDTTLSWLYRGAAR